MTQHCKSILKNQSGAIFGLDARITLAIFTVISVISAATLTLDMSRISGGALTDEVRGIGDAVEGMHSDLKIDIYKALIKPNSKNAFLALIQDDVIKTGQYRSRWIGPYLKHLSNTHPKYGLMEIHKQGREHTATCHPTTGCFLWLTMNSVEESIIEKTNSNFDGEAEAIPSKEGRIQWGAPEGEQPPGRFRMWYRIAPAIN